jgi:hypothetical protein
MRWARPVASGLGLAVIAAAVGACGSASAGGGDPVAVAQGYIDAVKGNPGGGTQFLASESTEKLTGSTALSRWVAKNKGATLQIVKVPWIPPGGGVATPNDKQCLVVPPQGGTLCIVTVEAKARDKTLYFHLDLENRYTGKYEIINVDTATKPDELLPTGNQAHTG